MTAPFTVPGAWTPHLPGSPAHGPPYELHQAQVLVALMVCCYCDNIVTPEQQTSMCGPDGGHLPASSAAPCPGQLQPRVLGRTDIPRLHPHASTSSEQPLIGQDCEYHCHVEPEAGLAGSIQHEA